MKRTFIFTIGLAFCLLWNTAWPAAESLSAAKMEEVDKLVHEKGAAYGPENVLVVFDLDNTLLTLNQVLGSDQWFQWQAELIAKNEQSEARVADNVNDLAYYWARLVMFSDMHLVEPSIPEMVSKFQSDRYSVIVETSRSPILEITTKKTVNNNGMDFSKTKVGRDIAGSFVPVTPNRRGGLSEQEIQDFGMQNSWPVSYKEGLFLTAGQHKGAMLRVLLHKMKSKYKAIVFVDDTERHCQRVFKAFENSPLDVVSVLYTFEHPKIEAFRNGDKTQVIADWKKFHDEVRNLLRPDNRFTHLARGDAQAKRVSKRVNGVSRERDRNEEKQTRIRSSQGRGRI